MSQQANEAMAERLIDLYNTEVHAMIDQCHPQDLRISVNGVLALTDRDKFHRAESRVLWFRARPPGRDQPPPAHR
ncbi:hypothetical protein ACWDQL_30545 [Streptomyces olivaceus]